MTCSFQQTPTPPIRQESLVDAVSDIVIQCVGGQQLTAGAVVPTANIAVTLNTTITSRLVKSSDAVTGASEALLLIDEPGLQGTVVANGYGVNATQKLCGNAGTGCGPSFVSYVPTNGVAVGLPAGSTTPVALTAGGAAAPNVYQGVVSGATVTFYGVPVLPPGTTTVTRTFRITNIRANPSAAGLVGSTFGVTPISASISSNNVLPLSGTLPPVGYVQSSLATSLSLTPTSSGSPTYQTFAQCLKQGVSATANPVTVLNFAEKFGSAFKTRVVPLTNTSWAAQSTNAGPAYIPTQQPGSQVYAGYGSGQSVPGGLPYPYSSATNSESDFIFPIATTCVSGSDNSGCAGLADFGTRFKAVFTNIPAGVSLYVSVTNIVNPVNGIGTPGGTNFGYTTNYPLYAQMVSGETAPESLNASSVLATGNVSFGGIANAIQLVPVNGSAEAVWEVINANPNGLDTFQFGVYAAFAALAPPATSPTAAPSVLLSYAPTPTGINGNVNFSATGGAAAQPLSGYPIPRFLDTTSYSQFMAINICQTALLWPYVVTGAPVGIETGLAVSNTTMDPFGTVGQAGSCDLWWYGSNYTSANAPVATATLTTWGCDQAGANSASCVAAYGSKVIPAGQTWFNTAGNLQPVPSGDYWAGYVIGICRFQDAHGYAALADPGLRNFLSAYLALVIQGSNYGADNLSRTGTSSITGAPILFESLAN